MNNINLAQFANRFLDFYANRRASNNVVGAGNSQNAQGNEKPAPNLANQMSAGLNKPDVMPPQIQFAQLSGLEKAVLIKDIMNIPKEFRDFLLMLNNLGASGAEAKNLNQLLGKNLDLAKLVLFMQENGKEAMNKLVLLMGEMSKAGGKNEQLKELMFIVNACIPTAGTTQAGALKNLMLLYLPWLPLGEGSGFELEIETSEEEGSQQDETITILISTLNFGNVKILLTKQSNPQNLIQMHISCSKNFPKEKVEKAIDIEAKNNNIKTGVIFEQQQTVTSEKKETEAKVNMSASKVLSPFLILMAHNVIKIVIEIDKNHTLIETRRQGQSLV